MTHASPTGDTPPSAPPPGRLRRLATLVPLVLRVARRMAVTHGGYRAAFAYCARILRWEGIAGLRNRMGRLRPAPSYAGWVAQYDTFGAAEREAALARIATLQALPRFAIVVPAGATDAALLDETIRSIRAQVYPHWKLAVVCDAAPDSARQPMLAAHRDADPRIRAVPTRTIESADALLGTCDFVLRVDAGDVLAGHALFLVARYLEREPKARLVYGDEDGLDAHGARTAPDFKPDWNPLLFHSRNLFARLGVFEAALVREAGGLHGGASAGLDYDLALRCVERAGDGAIVHVPHVLCHHRASPRDVAALDADRAALQAHLQRTGLPDAQVETLDATAGILRVHYPAPRPAPLVSIIVPTRDYLALLRTCIDSLMRVTRYPNYEIIVVDNGSVEPPTLAYFDTLAQLPNVRILRDDSPFNFSALNNRAAAIARGQYLCLLNNDTEMHDGNWLDEMMAVASLPGIGAVGAALRYPDGQLQHGGVLLGLNGTAGHFHHMLPRGEPGYRHRALSIQNVSAVTAACLVVSRAIYQQVGGLEETLCVAFNDVDFCLKVRAAGYRNAWTPFAELTHHESASRGTDMSPEKRVRFEEEARRMAARWGDALLNDPAYNPNLSLADNVPPFSYAEPPRIGMLD